MSQKQAKKKRKETNLGQKPPPLRTIKSSGYKLPLFVLLLITLLVYLPVFGNGFVNYDDNRYILNNPMLPEFNLSEIFSRLVEGNYHPLTMLVYSFEYQLFGLKPEGYHAVNLLLHLLNTLLVFRVLINVSNKLPVALIGALLFGVHPLHVESVAWASELKDLLYTFFFLGSWLLYLRYSESGKKKFYLMAVLVFLLSLLSKAMAASLPIVLLFTDYFKGRKLNRSAWLEKIPFFALAIIFGLVAINAQKAGSAIQDLDYYSFPQRVVFACYGFISYIIKAVIPFELSVYYPYPTKTGSSIPGWYYIYPVLMAGLVGLVIYSLKFSKKIFFGIGIFAATVFLVLQLLPVGNTVMADRYSYIPSIGLFYLFGEAAWWLWNKIRLLSTRRILMGAGILILFAYCFLTFERIGTWKNSFLLWDDVIRKYQEVPVAYNNRGMALDAENKTDEALADYSKTIELQPDFAFTYNNRGNIYLNRNNYTLAMEDYNNSIRYDPELSEPYNGKGVIFMRQGQFDSATIYFQKAIERKPFYPEAHCNMGVCKHSMGRKAEGCADIQKAQEMGMELAAQLINQLCR